MRITGGTARGIPLQSGKAKGIRPATDKMRERVFSSIGSQIEGASVIDLFAGTGAYGLEALSRGARELLFVEKQADAIQALKRNMAAVRRSMGQPEDLCMNAIQRDVLHFSTSQRFDFVFLDPPYPLLRQKGTAILNMAQTLLNPEADGFLVLEKPGDWNLPFPSWTVLKSFGKSGTDEPSVVFLAPA